MAEDESQDKSTSAGQDQTPKKETVRITLPPRPADLQVSKRETVRIDVPGKPVGAESSGGDAGQRTQAVRVNVPTGGSGIGAAPAPPPPVGVSRPSVPPPSVPKPPLAANLSTAPSVPKPPSPAGSELKPPFVPKPPAPGKKPVGPPTTIPRSAVLPSAASYSDVRPVEAKTSAPKKETARIQVPTQTKAVPRATLKTQQTREASPTAPLPAIQPSSAVVDEPDARRRDLVATVLAIVALLAAAVSAFLSYLAFTSA